MVVKINAQVTGYGPQPGNTQALVIVTVEFDGPPEAMTFTVLVPNDGDEGMVRDQASLGRRTLRSGSLISAGAYRRRPRHL
jgi:hypothetical protein